MMSNGNKPPSSAESGTLVLPPGIVKHLKSSFPWIRFLAVLMFILCGLIFLGSILSFSAKSLSGFGPAIGITNLIVCVLYFFPALFLHRYSKGLKTYDTSNQTAALEKAFLNGKKFWKFISIMTIIVLIFTVIGVTIGLAVFGSALSEWGSMI